MTNEGLRVRGNCHPDPDFAYATIICSKEVKGVWTKPEVVFFGKDP